jgi:hypothetical protein
MILSASGGIISIRPYVSEHQSNHSPSNSLEKSNSILTPNMVYLPNQTYNMKYKVKFVTSDAVNRFVETIKKSILLKSATIRTTGILVEVTATTRDKRLLSGLAKSCGGELLHSDK